jgi:hypothetical protein
MPIHLLLYVIPSLLPLSKLRRAGRQMGDNPLAQTGWRAVAGNDDIAAGWTLRSQLTLTPDWNSIALWWSRRASAPTCWCHRGARCR